MTDATLARIAALVGGFSLAAAAAHAQCAPPVQRLIADRKYPEARAEAQAQLARSAKDDQAMDCMGKVLTEQGDPGSAVSWFEKAIAINGRSAPHHLGLAAALRADAPN